MRIISTIVTVLCIFGCSQGNQPKRTDNTQETSRPTVTLENLVYVDMFAQNYTTQHPLVCGREGRDFPDGKEMVFKQSNSKESVHVVFPANVMPPKKFDGKFILHGDFQGIQNRDVYKFKKPKEDYRYFVVSSWENKK